MMPAAKHGDPQLGVDIHLCVVPPSPSPVPLPTPHMSVVFDPFDYIPYIGATVTVCGMKRATAGTNGIAVHIPPGFPFAPKLPDKDDELFMGSATVVADGDPFSHIAHPVLACQVAGMMSPIRPKKKGGPMACVLPTVFNVATPSTVFLGGPPTISLMGMAFKAGFKMLGKLAKSGLFKRIRQKLFKNMKPGFLKCKVLRAEPVNILTGAVSVQQSDFTLPGRIPIEWVRSYGSDNPRLGACGYGWETLADIRLEVDPSDGTVSMRHPTVGPLFFPQLPRGLGEEAGELELMDGARLTDNSIEFQVRTKEDCIYHFAKNLARVNAEGATEYGIWRIADLCGNWLDFDWQDGRVVGIDGSAGRRIEIVSKDGRITEVALRLPETEFRQVFVRYEYDEAGDLVFVIDAVGNPYTFGYDEHHLVRHTDRRGLSFYYEYDRAEPEGWRVVRSWGDGGLYDYRFAYEDTLNERRITDSLDHVSIVKLDERGLPISEIDPLGGMTNFEYDEAGRATALIDQDDHRTEYAYDERGNLLKLTRPDGRTIKTEFTTANKAVTIADPNGSLWQQKWDSRGLLVEQTTPLGNFSRYEYDARGQLVAFINPRGARTELTFDAIGNLASLKDALGHSTCFAYDVLGNVTTKLDRLDRRTYYRYDEKSRLTEVHLPSGATIRCAYDADGNLIRYVDEKGAETKLEYFGLGEIAKRMQPDGHSVEYHYDTEERLVGVTNQRGEIFRLQRDDLGRIVGERDYWGQARHYSYTPCGYLKESVDPLGRAIRYQTDPLGRILNKVLPDPAQPEAVQIESFEYDANGNLLACANAAIRIERKFDPEGHLLEEKQGASCIVTNAYDVIGNPVTRTTTRDIAGRRLAHTVHYGYDALGQVVQVEAEGHAPIELTRNALGQLTQETLSASVQRHLDYNPDGYVTSQRVLAAEGPVFEQYYRYDPAGNLIEKRDSAFGIDQYTYDPADRLVAHLDPQGRLKRYLNDPAGDRLRTCVRDPMGEPGQDSDWRREGEHDGSYYRFDRAGNLTERKGPEGDLRLVWDANQRLIQSSMDGKTTTYHYDPLGRRLSKQTGAIATHFCWDGDALLGDATVIDGGESGPTMQLAREWVFYPGTFEPLALVQSYGTAPTEYATPPDFFLYHNDPNGCPTRLLDTAGKVVWAAQYGACGRVERLHVNRTDNPIRLQGQYVDNETSLHYNRFRYYLPSLGQFVSSDPLTLFSGPNTYDYAYGNPFLFVDPLGLECWSTARKKFWKNEAIQNPNKYSAANLARLQQGKAPKITATVQDSLGNIKKVDVSMELHHAGIPQRVGGPGVHSSSNLSPLTPWDHENIDPFRHTGQQLISIDKGVDLW